MRRICVLLETARMVLRQFTEDDASKLFDLDSDPEVMRFLTGGTPTPSAAIEADILPHFLCYDERFPGFGFWAAIDKAAGDFIGWFSLRPLREQDPREASLGFRLHRTDWGRGYATEGAQALIRLGFTGLGVQLSIRSTRLTGNVKRGNRMIKPLVAVTIGQVHYQHMMNQAAWEALATFAIMTHYPGRNLQPRKICWPSYRARTAVSPFGAWPVRMST
jgi:RimJ/RimL family protein N-acetyltransferase